MEIEQLKLKYPEGTKARLIPYSKTFLILITWPDGSEEAVSPTNDLLEYFGLLKKFKLAEESLIQPDLMESINKALLAKPMTVLRSKQNIDSIDTQKKLKPVMSAHLK